MKSLKDIINSVKQFKVNPRSEMRSRVLDEALKIHRNGKQPSTSDKYTWRTIMKSRRVQFAAAAVAILVIYLCLQIPNNLIAPAYALQDTIKAHNSVRYLHIKGFITIGGEKWDSESWMEFDEYGKLRRFRHQADQFTTGPIGPLTFVNDGNGSYIWLPNLNLCLKRSSESGFPSHLLQREISGLDPKLAFEKLRRQARDGEIILDVNEPDQKNKPIVLVVTYPAKSLSANWKKVLYVDQATRLVEKEEKFVRWGDRHQHVLTTEFFDYNQQIDPQMFNIKGELPVNVTMIDQSEQEYGLAQGDMTDEEITTEVTSQFVQALIAKDYDKAGRLFAGLPGFLTERMLGVNVLKIISVGPAHPDPDPDLSQMICFGRALGEVGGLYFEFDANIRVAPVSSQPGRWTICRIMGNSKPVSGEMIQE